MKRTTDGMTGGFDDVVEHQGRCGVSTMSGWLSNIAEKMSWDTYEAIKHDMNEFGSVMTAGTRQAIETAGHLTGGANASAGAGAGDSIRHGFSSIMSGVTNLLTVPPDDSEDLPFTVNSDGEAVYDRLQAEVLALRRQESTFLQDPQPTTEEQADFLANFHHDAKKEQISSLLVKDAVLRQTFSKLVPLQVSSEVFWRNYFYRVWLLERKEAIRRELLEKSSTADDAIKWEDDWLDSAEAVDHKPPVPAEPAGASQSSTESAQPTASAVDSEKTPEPPAASRPSQPSSVSSSSPSSEPAATETDLPKTGSLETRERGEIVLVKKVGEATPSSDTTPASQIDLEEDDPSASDQELTAEELELARQAAHSLAASTAAAGGAGEDDWENWE